MLDLNSATMPCLNVVTKICTTARAELLFKKKKDSPGLGGLFFFVRHRSATYIQKKKNVLRVLDLGASGISGRVLMAIKNCSLSHLYTAVPLFLAGLHRPHICCAAVM